MNSALRLSSIRSNFLPSRIPLLFVSLWDFETKWHVEPFVPKYPVATAGWKIKKHANGTISDDEEGTFPRRKKAT